MMQFPIQFRSDELVHEVAEMESKISAGIAQLTSMTDDDVDIGSTPKDVLYARETFQVYHYKPMVDKEKIHPVPMLMSTPLINGYEVLDLQPDRSLVRNLLNEGMDVYMINWGYPKRSDRFTNIDDYVTDYIDDIADKVIENSGADKINLFGVCMGGTLATCYSALQPEKVRNLVLTVTPIDFFEHEVEGQPHVGLLFRDGPDGQRRCDGRCLRQRAGGRAERLLPDGIAVHADVRQVRRHDRPARRQGGAPQLPAHGEVAVRRAVGRGRSLSPVHQGVRSEQQAW